MKKILLSILCLFSIFAVRAEEVTVTFSELGYENGTAISSYDFDENITAIFDKGTNQNVPKYYNSGAALRIYGGGTMSITAPEGVTINSVSFTTTGSNTVNAESTVSAGTLTIGDASTPTTITDINASEVVFTQGGTSGHVRIVTLTVDYTPAVAAAVAKPTASVANGAILYNITNVELSGEGTIHYTTDGTEPTAESAVYSEAIAISEFGKTTTIKAIAINGEESSEVATFNYELKVAAPVFSVKGGVSTKKTGDDGLTFTCETEGATILYNNRGKDPITEGNVPWGTLSVLASSTIQAVAYVTNADGEKVYSEISKEEYIITTTQPFKPASAIESGKKYLVVYDGNALIPHESSKNYGYMSGKKVDFKGEFIETFEYYGFTITQTATAGEYVIMGGDKRYLYIEWDSNNNTWYKSFNVASDTTGLGDKAIWTVAIADDNTATITNKASGFTVQYSSYKNFETSSSATALPTLYEMREYPTITITPENYSTVEGISTIVVTCEEGIALNESDELYATYSDPDWNSGLDLGMGKVSDDGKSVIYELATPLTANGGYTITFPAGLFTLFPDGLATASESTRHTLYVENLSNLEIVYSNPMNNKTLESIEYLYFEFNQDIVDNVNGAVITDENGTEYSLSVTYIDAWEEDVPYSALCLKTSEPITTPGTYTFVLKQNYVCASSSADIKLPEDVTYTFTIEEPLTVTEVSTIKDETTNAITELYIEFNNDISCYAEAFYVTGPDNAEYFFTPTLEDAEGNELPWNAVRAIATEPITIAGTYTVYITSVYPASSMGMTGGVNEMYTINYEGSTTGIKDTIAEGNDKMVIYDLTGRRVNNINKAGIYIVNGVKTVVE